MSGLNASAPAAEVGTGAPVPALAGHGRHERLWRHHPRHADALASPPPIPRRLRPTGAPRASALRTAAYGFPLAASSPRRARRHTVDFAHRWGLGAAVEPAELLVSELMTNAYEATRSCVDLWREDPALAAAPLQLRLAVERARLRIEVRDRSPQLPVPDDPRLDDERGRGLLLVETFSERWGYHPLPNGGKAVWCVVAPLPTTPRDEGRPHLRGAGPPDLS
ncbi:MAG TPA: ATP-binding protein [Acidimicrobiales bacterium]